MEYVQQFRVEGCKQANCRDAIVDAASLNEFGLRVALVARADMLSSFFDDVTHNRAAQMRVFTDLESAQCWIHERQSVEAA